MTFSSSTSYSSSSSTSSSSGLNYKDFLTQVINSNKVVVFSKTYCPYCVQTKQLFQEMKVEAKIFELDTMETGNEIQDALEEFTSQTTVPNVFVMGKHIGGNDSTQKAKRIQNLQK